MAKYVELRRHTAHERDILTPDGVSAAVEIGTRLAGGYDLLISSGAPRATQTLACFLAGMGQFVPSGVTVDPHFRSEVEDRWATAAARAEGGALSAFLAADPDLVEAEAKRFGEALRRVFEALPDEGRALVVGHSPTHETAVWGLTGQMVHPIARGGGVLVIEDQGAFNVRSLD